MHTLEDTPVHGHRARLRLPRTRPADPAGRAARWTLALLVLLVLVAANHPAAAAERWVRGSGEPTTCAGRTGYNTLQAALAGLDPTEANFVMVSRTYQHSAAPGAGNMVVIGSSTVAENGRLQIVGGYRCVAGVLQRTDDRSPIAAINGDGPVLLVESRGRVDLDRLEITGGRRDLLQFPGSAAGLAVLAAGAQRTRVTLRNVALRDHQNDGAAGGAMGIFAATVDLYGVEFTDNRARLGAAIHVAPIASRITITQDTLGGRTFGALFQRNRALGNQADGGAIHLPDVNTVGTRSELVIGAADPIGSPVFSFVDNFADRHGGAIRLGAQQRLELLGKVVFRTNSAGQDGGAVHMVAGDVGEPFLGIDRDNPGNRVQFEINQAGRQGGALSCAGTGTASNLPAIDLGSVEFIANRAQLRGGAIASERCRIDGVRSEASRLFSGNSVLSRQVAADPAERRGGGAVFVSSAAIRLGLNTATDRTDFSSNSVSLSASQPRTCSGTDAWLCVARGMSGGAVLVTGGSGAAYFYGTRFTGNQAPVGGAIAMVDGGPLIVDMPGQGCGAAPACSVFRDNVADGANLIASDGAPVARGLRGAGAAVLVASAGNAGTRIQRSLFAGNHSACPQGRDCNSGLVNHFDGRVVAVRSGSEANVNIRGNVFAANGDAGAENPAPTGPLTRDDALVEATVAAPASGAGRSANIVMNTFSERCAAPALVTGRRLEVFGNVLYGCPSTPASLRLAGTTAGVATAVCNLADGFQTLIDRTQGPAPVYDNVNFPTTRRNELFVDAAGLDFALAPQVDIAVDACGTVAAGRYDLRPLVDALGHDMRSTPRPLDDPLAPNTRAGLWDIGAHERLLAGDDRLFRNGFD